MFRYLLWWPIANLQRKWVRVIDYWITDPKYSTNFCAADEGCCPVPRAGPVRRVPPWRCAGVHSLPLRSVGQVPCRRRGLPDLLRASRRLLQGLRVLQGQGVGDPVPGGPPMGRYSQRLQLGVSGKRLEVPDALWTHFASVIATHISVKYTSTAMTLSTTTCLRIYTQYIMHRSYLS